MATWYKWGIEEEVTWVRIRGQQRKQDSFSSLLPPTPEFWVSRKAGPVLEMEANDIRRENQVPVKVERG